MIALVLFGLVTASAAVPQDYLDHYNERIFSSNLTYRMRKIDEMIGKLHDRFDTAANDSKIEGNQLIITVPLSPFNENDISVRVMNRLMIVLAINTPPRGGKISYVDVKALPTDVELSGSWTFDSEKNLRIIFPIKDKISNNNAAYSVKSTTATHNIDQSAMVEKDFLATVDKVHNTNNSEFIFGNDDFVVKELLPEFDEKDIFTVKAVDGFLMAQAFRNPPEGGEMIFHRAYTLPPPVGDIKAWTFTADKKLTITLSMKKTD